MCRRDVAVDQLGIAGRGTQGSVILPGVTRGYDLWVKPVMLSPQVLLALGGTGLNRCRDSHREPGRNHDRGCGQGHQPTECFPASARVCRASSPEDLSIESVSTQ